MPALPWASWTSTSPGADPQVRATFDTVLGPVQVLAEKTRIALQVLTA
jgi:hypothetical protein